jgi:hypothetical protein
MRFALRALRLASRTALNATAMRELGPLAMRAHEHRLLFERQMRPPPAYFAFAVMFYWNTAHA